MALAEVPQLITPEAVYVSQEAMRRLSMGNWAWRSFRAKSKLKTTRIGTRVYVKGCDIIDAIDRLSNGGTAVI